MTPDLTSLADTTASIHRLLRFTAALLLAYARRFAGRWGEAARRRAWRDLAALEALTRRFIRLWAEDLAGAVRPALPVAHLPLAAAAEPDGPAPGPGRARRSFPLGERARPPSGCRLCPPDRPDAALRLETNRLAFLERLARLRPVLSRPERFARRLARRLLRGCAPPPLRPAPQTRHHLRRLEPQTAGFLARLDAAARAPPGDAARRNLSPPSGLDPPPDLM